MKKEAFFNLWCIGGFEKSRAYRRDLRSVDAAPPLKRRRVRRCFDGADWPTRSGHAVPRRAPNPFGQTVYVPSIFCYHNSMKRFISLFSIVAISLWILPLGAFIKPSQEKTACGGNRAFHMCTGMSQPQKDSTPRKTAFTSNVGVEKTNSSAAGAGTHFLTAGTLTGPRDNSARFLELNLIFPRQVFFLTPEPIPKI